MEKSKIRSFQFGARGSEEYRKLTTALDAAEIRRNKLEDDLASLKEIVRIWCHRCSLLVFQFLLTLSQKTDLEKELKNTTGEIERLQIIKDSMSKLSDESKERKATRNVFIKDLDYATTEEDLEVYFERYGNIKSVKVARNHAKQSRGYGFVEFEQVYMADRALEFTPHYIRGRRVQLDQAEHEYNHNKKSYKFKPY